MRIKSLTLKDYRNHEQLELKEVSKINFIKGPNASGKSNIMEALMRLNSYSGKRDNIIRFGVNCAVIKAKIERKSNIFEYCFLAQRENEKIKIKKRFPQGPLPIIGFGSEESNFFNRGPAARRCFLDTAAALLKEKHKRNILEYKKIVKQKNDLLKKGGVERALLWSFNNQLVKRAESIIKERLAYLAEIENRAAMVYKKLSGGKTKSVTLKYITKTNTENIRESLTSQLRGKEELEERVRFCIVGPHRDDFMLYIDNLDVAVLGSGGEKKSASLALKVAQVEDLKKKRIKPLLILDDALSELDIERRQLLLDIVFDCEQVFITSTNDLGLSIKEEIKRYELRN